ncbi:hypothetical protein RKE30_38900 [Streptomyces sp. Li-HN-5-11]|uniref:hypothetical protein n=1 Tax=Streptomyces sp. Li-HN-5-11 TaxID=3075432 RepID=UPI0028B01BA9|nr:hypothetical protein [Streptomyces sp. Li-HN-5-11]WNM35903.1 hypothetical protein RKE30_38900 [Streptomyces sp. Li-HN-5-11]
MSGTAPDISLDTFRTDQDTVPRTLPALFRWVRHLSAEESRRFVAELVDATQDAVQQEVPRRPPPGRRRVAGDGTHPRGTARILADPELTAELTRRLPDEDHGEVTAP